MAYKDNLSDCSWDDAYNPKVLHIATKDGQSIDLKLADFAQIRDAMDVAIARNMALKEIRQQVADKELPETYLHDGAFVWMATQYVLDTVEHYKQGNYRDTLMKKVTEGVNKATEDFQYQSQLNAGISNRDEDFNRYDDGYNYH